MSRESGLGKAEGLSWRLIIIRLGHAEGVVVFG